MKFFVVIFLMLSAFNSQAVELGAGKKESMVAAALDSKVLGSLRGKNAHLSNFVGANISPVKLNHDFVREADVYVNYMVGGNPCSISIVVAWENTSLTRTPNFRPVVKGLSGASVSCKLSK